MRKTTFKPNYPKAERAARKLLKLNSVDRLPVRVKKLAKSFPNLQIRKYSWYAKKYGYSHKDVCELVDSEEGCCWYFKAFDMYMILYNEKVTNTGRIRWTIAHELGHYMLKHNEITNKAVLSRSSLSDEEYDTFEKEANCFARELLAPPPVIRELNISNPQFISDIGDVSIEAATNINNFILNGIQRGVRYPHADLVIKRFSNFISNVKYSKWCNTCNTVFSNKKAAFCPVCGNNQIYNNSIFYARSDSMIYSSIKINNQSAAIACPRCNNENIKGSLCQICGSFVINRCSGTSDHIFSDQYAMYNTSWHQTTACEQGQYLDGEDRYCIHCGAISTFYAQGFLNSWETEQGQYEEPTKLELAASSDIKSDDLPF